MLLKSSFKGYCLCKGHRRKGGLMRVLSAAHQHLLLTGQLCTWTKCAQLHWFFSAYGGKTLLPSPWRSTKIVHSHHLSQTWGSGEEKKKCFMSPGHSPTGCWQRQQMQSGWKRSWSKKWYYQDTSYVSLSLSCSLQVSLPKSPTGFPEKPLKYLK